MSAFTHMGAGSSTPTTPVSTTIPTLLHELVYMIGRCFYEPKYLVILDMLTEERVIRDDHLACRMKLSTKEANKLAQKLKHDRLVGIEAKTEVRLPGAGGATGAGGTVTATLSSAMAAPGGLPFGARPTSRNYIYIDYKQLVNVTKYKMFKLRHMLEASIGQDVIIKHNYVCNSCGTRYGLMELSYLLDPVTQRLICSECQSDQLGEEKTAAEGQGAISSSEGASTDGDEPGGSSQATSASATGTASAFSSTHARLMDQCLPIIELLRKTDALAIPAFQLTDHIDRANDAAVSALAAADGAGVAGTGLSDSQGDASAGRAFAHPDAPTQSGSSSAASQAADHYGVIRSTVTVDFEGGGAGGSSSLKKQRAESSKRPALPIWHTHSTVTGEAIHKRSAADAIAADNEADPDEPDPSEVEAYYRSLQQHKVVAVVPDAPAVHSNGAVELERVARTDSFSLSHTISSALSVLVQGQAVPLSAVTEVHRDRMTPDEYEAYYRILIEQNLL